jgi:hypothetical protein
VSCFESEFEEQAFKLSTGVAGLNLPSNISSFMPGVLHDLELQVKAARAATTSLAHKCRDRTGDALAYMGLCLLGPHKSTADTNPKVPRP